MRINHNLQNLATQFRSKWDIGSKDPIRFKSLLIKLNIIVLFKQLSEKFSGVSFMANDNKFMLINSEHPLGRQNFTVCHEIYHLCVQRDFTLHSCITEGFDRRNKSEYNADLFAAYLLMPESGFFDFIPKDELKKNKISLPTILKIEQFYECSRTALLYRLDSLNLIDVGAYELFRYNVSKEARQYGYDASLYYPGRHGLVIGDYGIIAKELFDKEKISESHYISLLRDIGIDVEKENEQHEQS